MPTSTILVYLLRRDLRVSDNPILDRLATTDHAFTHLLPVYIFDAQQMETSGFVQCSTSPYPEARSRVAGYRRCGPHRAKFVAQSVWKLKEAYESLGCGMIMRVGLFRDVVEHLLDGLPSDTQVGAVWMTEDIGVEEERDEKAVRKVCKERGVEFQLWKDEKYYIDDHDLPVESLDDLPNVFAEYRKSLEPLSNKPRAAVPRPSASKLPPFPDATTIPDQCKPFVIPASIESLEQAVVDPVEDCLPNVGRPLSGAEIAHTFEGGEESALERAHQLILSGELKDYKETRNMLGNKFSAKLSAFLALGCITARQVHHRLIKFEEGLDSRYESVEGYGGGESPGTASLRSQLLYRDYTRLCAIKAKGSLFRLGGIKGADPDVVIPGRIKDLDKIAETMARVFAGTTGMSLVDASQRELIFTGYTSNRARQIVATYLTRNLGMDWPYGAEMYEALLVDYDVASNWANWQYFAGFGNKAGGSNSRVANPVHQSFKYDKDGSYVRAWLPELAGLVELKYLFQPAMAPKKLLEQLGLHQSPQCVNAVGTISYSELDPRSQRQLEWRKRNRQGARVIRTDEASSSRRSDFHGLWRTWGHDNDGEMSGRGRVEFRLE